MPFGSLWLPVVVSAVAVWLVSAVLHMVLKYHRADFKQLANEEAVAPALRSAAPARHSLDPGAAGIEVMRLAGTVAFIGYAFGSFQESIWHGVPWSNSLRSILDGAVYALVTGLAFRFLWPGA